MRFNPKALLIAVGFFAMVGLSQGSGNGRHLAEAITTLLILLGIAGYFRQRSSSAGTGSPIR